MSSIRHASGRRRPVVAAATAILFALAAAGCGAPSNGGPGTGTGSSTPGSPDSGSAGGSSPATGTAAGARYPVTVTTCGQQVTFDSAPKRAVTNDINTFEDMAALGLEPSMVGDFGLDGYGPDGRTDVPARYAGAFKAVKQTSPSYVTLEPLVGLDPDFLFAGWNYGLQVGSTLTPDNLAKYGIKTLVLAESCAHVEASKQSVGINDTYSDLADLGRIFGVEARATGVINAMKAQIASVQAKLSGQAPKKVFLYDSGTSAPFTAPGLAMPDALIRLAGGTNVFHDLKQTWTTVSWEQVVKSDPDCIVINDYGKPTYTQKQTFLETSPLTRNLRAVKDGCFIHLTYGELTPSPLNGDAVVAMAKALHPDATA